MITRIEFDGYRLLDDFKADLGQLTVLIGANATGKSTLLDAVSMITHAMDASIEDVVSFRGGMWSIPNCGRECSEIGWQVTFGKLSKHPIWSQIPLPADTACTYAARLGRDRSGQVVPVSEVLRHDVPRPGHRQPFKMLEAVRGSARIFDPKSGKLTPFDSPDERTQTVPVGNGDQAASSPASSDRITLVLSRMRFEHQFPIPTSVRAYLSSFCFYPGFDVARGSVLRNKAAELRPTTTLNAVGDNLGTVLHEFLTRHEFREQKDDVEDFLRTAYPQIEAITAETAYGGEPRILVRLRETGFGRATEVWEISDGMLRFLLLCVALLNPRPALIFVDEPEAGLHPRLLPIVADVIRSAAERTQVLVTTHSPQLLNCFDLDCVAVQAREGARARWYRPSNRASLRKMLESQVGGTLGELHTAGELEGMA